MTESPWLSWQIVDSAFPTGAFAHSGGLEAAWQQGEVGSSASLRAFVRASIVQAGYGTLPFVNAVYLEPSAWLRVDQLAEAFLTNAVANRASRTQGRALLSTSMRVWSCEALSDVADRAPHSCVHLAPVTGAVFEAIGLPRRTAQQVVLFATARGVLAAAVRLGVCGSYEAQRLQADAAADLDDVLDRCADLDESALAQTAPIIDLLQSTHDRLYSRLFQS